MRLLRRERLAIALRGVLDCAAAVRPVRGVLVRYCTALYLLYLLQVRPIHVLGPLVSVRAPAWDLALTSSMALGREGRALFSSPRAERDSSCLALAGLGRCKVAIGGVPGVILALWLGVDGTYCTVLSVIEM